MKKKQFESVGHFVTVIGIMWEDVNDDSLPLKERTARYEEAIQYTLDFIKYRFNPRIKRK